MSLLSQIDDIWEVLRKHDSKIRDMDVEKTFKEFFKRKMRMDRQRNWFRGLHLAICVDTLDPLKMNRVRYFSPVMHEPKDGQNSGRETKIEQLDWAWPISAMGGIDDSGMTWVPPAGSTLCLLFQNGNPNTAYYIGTTWQKTRGREDEYEHWGFSIPEYDKIYRGHRKGYMIGKNDESQFKPPFTNDNYQGNDIDSSVDYDLVPDATTKITSPHIYGWKTPQKHTVIADDGDPKCNYRFKRFEIISSLGQYFLMKDDPFNHCGSWVNPKCKISHVYIEPAICTVAGVSVISGISYFMPYPCDQGPENCPVDVKVGQTADMDYLGTEHLCPNIQGMSTISFSEVPNCFGKLKDIGDLSWDFQNEGRNKYQNHKHECFPFLKNGCGLPQTGIQLLERSGHAFVMDGSVEEPRYKPEWERSLEEADMDGCTGVYRGRTWWKSATGHYIELNDTEITSRIRGPRNGVTIGTACGNKIALNDHTVEGGLAGELRGVYINNTSGASLEMCDNGNQQTSPERKGGGRPVPFSRKAYVKLRSGYGLQLLFNDAQSQLKTDQQYIQLTAPQTDNLQRGPHMLHMQERATGPGQVFLRAGGDFVVHSYDHMVEVVGNDDNPSNKLEFVSNMKIVSVKDVYYNKAKSHIFWADNHIFLAVGKDGATGEGNAGNKTCMFPVVVANQPIPEYVSAMTGMKASEYVFASAVNEDFCENISSD